MPQSKTVTVTSYHGIGWDIKPGSHYVRKKPDAVKFAKEHAATIGASMILIYKDDGILQRIIRLRAEGEKGDGNE